MPEGNNLNLCIKLIMAEEIGKHSGIEFIFGREECQYLMRYAPLSYEIPELHIHFPLPIEDGLKTAKTTFSKPQVLNNTTLRLNGVHPITKEPKTLFEYVINCASPE